MIKFHDLLINEETYRSAICYWDDMFSKIIKKYNQTEQWRDYGERNYANGKLRMDGGSILCKISNNNKFVLINQNHGRELAPSLIGYVNNNDDETILFMSCVLTEEISEIIEKIIDTFVSDNYPLEEIENLLEENTIGF